MKSNAALLGDIFEVGSPASDAAAIVKSGEAAIKSANTPFLTAENGFIHSSPLGGGAFFNYAELEFAIQSTFLRSPAAPVSDTEVEVGGVTTNTVTLAEIQVVNPAMTTMLIPFLLVQFSASQLNALPAGVITVTATIPTEFNGNSVYNAIQVGVSNVANRVNLTIIPYILVQSKPRPILGLIRQNESVVVQATGLATGTRTTVIIPGTTHPAIRNSVLYGRQTG